MAKFAISKPAVVINNNPVAILPNTAKGNEGEGETTVRTQSGGGGNIELVITDNAEDKTGMFNMDIANTPENIELARGWKKNPGVNVIEVSGEIANKPWNRIYNACSITNNYEFELSSDGKLSLEWLGEPPI